MRRRLSNSEVLLIADDLKVFSSESGMSAEEIALALALASDLADTAADFLDDAETDGRIAAEDRTAILKAALAMTVKCTCDVAAAREVRP